MKRNAIRWLGITALVLSSACLEEEITLGGIDAGLAESGGDVVPPLVDAGDVGWRESAEPWTWDGNPYCQFWWSESPFDLWSDETGVYVLYGWEDVEPSGDPDRGWLLDGSSYALRVNDGTGWTDVYRGCLDWEPECLPATALAGRIGGTLVGWSMATGWMGSAVAFGEPGASRIWDDLSRIGNDFFVVNDDLAYALWHTDADIRVVRFDGTTGWSPLPVAVPFESAWEGVLWADENDLFLAAPGATLVSLEGDGWRIHDPGTLDNFTSIWGFDGDDVWVGSNGGRLYHYDGTIWSEVSWPSLETGGPCSSPSPIKEMWGADGTLYFITDTQLARWNGTGVDVLGFWPGTYEAGHDGLADRCIGSLEPVALWGNSPAEVFLLGSERSFAYDTVCGPNAFVLRWDGSEFHWM